MLNILARKREEELAKAKAKKDAKQKSQLINVSNACPDKNLAEKRIEHDRQSAHYFRINPGDCLTHPEVERQRQEVALYYEDKRRILMAKLLTALEQGADIHFADQKKIIWEEYHEEFLPHLLDTMCHIIMDNARIVFSLHPNEMDNRNKFFSRMPGMEEGSLHEQISIKVAVFLDESKKKILEATEKQCAQLTMKSMNIMATNVLNIEEEWKQKTKRDVENFHRLKMQEMSYKIEEEKDEIQVHWSRNFTSPRHARRTMKEISTTYPSPDNHTTTLSITEHDKYFIQAHRIKRKTCDDLENMVHDIRQEHYCNLNVKKLVDDVTEKYVDLVGPDKTSCEVVDQTITSEKQYDDDESMSLHSCYTHIAELRRMNLESDMFLQRMKSVASNLKAEYDALSNSLGLDRPPSFVTDLSKYDIDIDD